MVPRFDPVGVCIYCGATEGFLDKEHIIPLALNGTLILPKSSCRPCATITGTKIESFVTRDMMGPFRYNHGLKSRKTKPKDVRITADFRGAGAVRGIVDVPVLKFPPALVLPTLPPPRFLRGLEPSDTAQYGSWGWAYPERMLEFYRRNQIPADASLSLSTYKPDIFERFLAKIAHSYAVSFYGVNGFSHMLTDFIRFGVENKPYGLNYFVGSLASTVPPATEGQGLHQLALDGYADGTIVAEIRLFGQLGAPVYHVVVGKLKN